ncbi:hypothetical protein [Streptomyces sp. NRRL B-24484]|uniref:hypothetical protein n=1 Tax=Streptomyces sp. NRRL B-24484 TaxID=1463833 RepID=UPI0004BFB1CF|nr:hypothetical protein [Streptomyces sp. NRRL B-24484]
MLHDPLLTYLSIQLRAHSARLQAAHAERDRGALSIEGAILIGILVAMAIGLGVFLNGKLNEKEGQIK